MTKLFGKNTENCRNKAGFQGYTDGSFGGILVTLEFLKQNVGVLFTYHTLHAREVHVYGHTFAGMENT